MSDELEKPRVLLVAGPNGSGKIISRYFRSIANCALVAREVDRLYLYDNSIEGDEATLVLRAAEGKIVRMYQDPPRWMSPIVASLEN